ncbi:30S ribosomal protein S8 [Candidatus Saccharibacteria bacterium]|nr:30S ribosomal protein S8 [Candidatus Saccharibacteria bacterium]
MSTVSTDPIADMLARLRNAIAVNHHEVSVPHSKMKESVAQLLKANGFLDAINVSEGSIGKQLNIVISTADTNARITDIARVSKPGRRHYSRAGRIPVVKRGRGIVIVSTSKGLMTGEQAKKQGIGGELICKVY